jgi:NAD(P)-dependent dehydrogenase (short-subunit alcohol dehydrogenase family)
MDRVKGKVAIITGGGGGLGKAQALLLAREGAKVVVTDLDEAHGQSVAEEIKGHGGEAMFIQHDVSSEAQWKSVINETLKQFGKLDILVNNAGVIIFKNIHDTSLDEWRWLMSINLDGVFLGTKYAMEAMKKSGGGSIINISSAAGIIGTLDTSAYHASKGGVRIFTKAAALECSKAGYDYNIRVNSVHPGVMKTSMVEGLMEDEEKKKAALSWHPIGRFGEPEDVAYGVLYLASDESSFVTGTELVIDGGWTAH